MPNCREEIQHVIVDEIPSSSGLTDAELRATPVPVSIDSPVVAQIDQTMSQFDVQINILKELRKANLYLSILTDTEINNSDLE